MRTEDSAATSPPQFDRVALLGGVYSNHLALAAAIEDARGRGAEAIYCLGDLGAFGPNPDKVFPLLQAAAVPVVRGNYDDSIARGLDDCQCGYTDPRDNYYARLSYQYTFANTSVENRERMARFPDQIRIRVGNQAVLLCHGSPRRMNEFLWESATPTHFLEQLRVRFETDVIAATHTGLHWSRPLESEGLYVNVGALGRPANDGRADVWYTMLEGTSGGARATFVPVSYAHEDLAEEMFEEGLPDEFIETIRTGWWTTCLEVLPGKERARGRY